MLERKTDLGDIRFSRNVIMRIIEDAVSACDGKVILQNYKGKYVMSRNSVLFNDTEEGLEIEVNIVIRFGASIKDCARKMFKLIQGNVERVMGEKPVLLTIIVTGVQSREIAKRHIEFSG